MKRSPRLRFNNKVHTPSMRVGSPGRAGGASGEEVERLVEGRAGEHGRELVFVAADAAPEDPRKKLLLDAVSGAVFAEAERDRRASRRRIWAL